MASADSARVKDLISKWTTYRLGMAEPQRYCQLKTDLYQVRNPGWNGNPSLTAWPPNLVDGDDAIMAAVEHYFLSRCWVGTGEYPVWQVKAMIVLYDTGKMIGVTPRHNPTKPTTPITALQIEFQAAGVADGELDFAKSGKAAPGIKAPPKYF